MQNMVKSEYFPDIEDSAMPEGNMSAISGLQKAVQKAAFFICLLETKAINSGVWGRAPGISIGETAFVHNC